MAAPDTPDTPAAPVKNRGRLRVYLGAAPGVGKTVDMLCEARRRASRGTDVVIEGCTRPTAGNSPPSRSVTCPSFRGGSLLAGACI